MIANVRLVFEKPKARSSWPLVIVGTGIIAAIWLALPAEPPTPKQDPEWHDPKAHTAASEAESADLNAGAGCYPGDVWIENKTQEVWENVRIEVNGTWEYSPGAVIPGRQPYMQQLFTRSDGIRLNLSAIACQTIDIHATINGKRRHWNGSY